MCTSFTQSAQIRIVLTGCSVRLLSSVMSSLPLAVGSSTAVNGFACVHVGLHLGGELWGHKSFPVCDLPALQ